MDEFMTIDDFINALNSRGCQSVRKRGQGWQL
jgi:hypothetical protein